MEPDITLESRHGLRVLVIGGSVRAERTGIPVAAWTARTVAEQLADAEVDHVDLSDVTLPPSRELQPGGSIPTDLTERIDRADAFVFVTPEYNAGYPAALKDAIDWHYAEWSFKAATIVSYGVVGGWRANEQLRTVLSELSVVTARRPLGVSAPWNQFRDAPTGPVFVPDEGTAGAMSAAVDELAWWAHTLRAGRLATAVPA